MTDTNNCFNCNKRYSYDGDKYKITIKDSEGESCNIIVCEKCKDENLKISEGKNNKYYNEAPSMREELLKEEVEPFIKDVFIKMPKVNSILMFVAIFWADNSIDEPHKEFLFSSEIEPITNEKALRKICDNYYRNDESNDYFSERSHIFNKYGIHSYDYEKDWYSKAVPAFSSYCLGYGGQEWENLLDSFSLYAVYKRQGSDGDFIREIVGTQHCPHLEGIATEWEQFEIVTINGEEFGKRK